MFLRVRTYLIGRQIIRIPRFLSPRAFDGVSIDIGVVNGHDGVRCGLLRWKPEEQEQQRKNVYCRMMLDAPAVYLVLNDLIFIYSD